MPITQRTTSHRTAAWLALAAGAVLLAGCESLNPFGSGDESAEEEQREMLVAKGEENADEVKAEIDTDVEDSGEYPNLATVPNAPEAGMSPNQRLIIEEGLLADRENAQYIAGPPPKMLPRPGEEMPASPSQPVSATDLPSQSGDASSPAPATSAEPATTANDPPQSAAVPSGEQVLLVSIRFPEGSAQAPDRVDQVLEQVAMIQKQEDAFLRVVGHTAIGAADKDALSAERAEVIAARLTRLGAMQDKLIAEGRGDASPVAEGGDAQASRQNNRVEIFMIR